jgi:ribosome biogenesis GTPase
LVKIKRNRHEDYETYERLDTIEIPRNRKSKPKRESANLLQGVVTRVRGHHYDVQMIGEDASGGEPVRLCEIRGRLLQEKTWDTLVAVGDRVWIVPHGSQRGQIERIEDRHSKLSRQRPFVNVPAEDVILANPDQVLVVFAVAEPEPHLRMLDRFLVVAEANDLPAVICANKIDLTGMERAKELFGRYEQIGYQVLYTSAKTGEGIDNLRELLLDALTVFTGPSGAGKSSLVNAVQPDLNLQTGELRVMGKGKHTTRHAQLFKLSIGAETFVADTPGIREMGLYEIEPRSLGFYFREFVPFIHDCRFPNCTHDHEPDCAVRAAVERGDIDGERYESYLRLLHGELLQEEE